MNHHLKPYILSLLKQVNARRLTPSYLVRASRLTRKPHLTLPIILDLVRHKIITVKDLTDR